MRCCATSLILLALGCSASVAPSANSVAGSPAGGGSNASAGTSSGGGVATGGNGFATGGSATGGGATGGTTGSGGASTTGGAGAGGSAPHAVVPCDSAAVGVWEEVTPPEVLADADYAARKGFGVNAFVIDPLNTANITLGTDNIGIHRTTDCGATWTHVDTGKNGAALDGGTQWSMAIDPRNPDVIYTVSGYNAMGVFKTTNAGVDWEQTLAPQYAQIFVYNGFTAQVRVDPTDHLHLVITPHFTCQAGHSQTCFLQTADGGATWNVIENAPSSGEGARIAIIDHDTWFSGLGFGGLYRTSDGGATWKQLTDSQSYAYEVFHRPGGKYYVPTAFGLAQSSDGISWTGLSNSPGANIVTTSETRIYVGTGGHCVAGHTEAINPIASASITDPTHWTVETAYSNHWGSGDLQYDADHHMLYTSNCLGGFWRVRLE